MSTVRIVYTRPDGHGSVICPVIDDMDRARQAIPPDATNVHVCTVTDLPPTRRFRNAWRQAGAAPPHVDLPLARQRRLEEIREERAPRLLKADNDLKITEDRGDAALAARLRAHRQRLRDLPQTEQARLEALATPEDLDRYIPAWPEDPA